MATGPNLGVAYLTLLPTMKGSQKIIERELGGVAAEKIGGGISTRLTNGMKGVATAGMAVVGAAAGAALVKGFGRLKAIDQAQAKLKGLGSDTKTVELVMKNATAAVKGTAFGLDAAATAAAGAMAAGVKPGAALERNLKLVADAATIAGTDMGSMGAIFNKVAASNKVQMDVINQLHDAGVPALSFLAKTMGVTAEEASKMASAGKIDFATFQKAMEQGLGGAAQSSGNTFTGAMANVFASLGRIGAGIMSGVFPKIAPLFQRIQAALGPVEEKAKELGVAIGNIVTPMIERFMSLLEGGTGKLAAVKDVIGPLAGVFAALGSSGLAPIIGMVPGLGGLASKLTLLGGPLGLVAGGFLGLVSTSPELRAALGELFGAVSQIVTAMMPTLQQVVGVLSGVAVSALREFTALLSGAVRWIAGFIQSTTPWKDVLIALGVSIGGVVIAFKAWTTAGNTLKAAMGIWKAAQTAWTAASYGAVGASYAATAATKGQAVAAGLAAGAQRVLNAVMRANPLGLIVTAITAVVGALVYFFTQTETGKKLWAEFTRFLGEAWANISAFFTAAYENVIKPVFDAIGTAAKWLFENILAPGFRIAQTAFAIMAGIFQGVYDAILKPVFDGIGALFTWIWENIVQPYIGYVKLQIQALGAVFTWLYENAVKPVFDAVGAAFGWIYQNIIQPIVNFVKLEIRGWGIIMNWLYANAIKPAFDAIGRIFGWINDTIIKPIIGQIQANIRATGAVFSWLYTNAVKPAWDAISGTISTVWNKGIRPVIDTLVKIITSEPKKAFEMARDAIGKAWKGIQALAAAPVRFVVDVVLGGLVDAINLIPGVNLKKPKLPKGFSDGGYTGALPRDAVAGVVHGDEHVIRAASRRSIEARHPGLLDHMNRFGTVPGYRKGGLVDPLPRGSWTVSQQWGNAGHNGIDLAAASGTKVFAAADGVVQLAGVVPMGGNEIYIQHKNGLGTRYSHLSKFSTQVGAPVRAGNVIGRVGSTGMSTGPHLHYMVHNPGRGAMSYYPNVNPAPYMGVAAKDIGEGAGLLDGLVDTVSAQVKKAFPAAGMWVEAAAGLAKEAARLIVKVFTPKIGTDSGSTAAKLYDRGGIIPSGGVGVNLSGKPEAVLTNAEMLGFKSIVAALSGGQGSLASAAFSGMADAFTADVAERFARPSMKPIRSARDVEADRKQLPPIYVQNPFTGEYLIGRVAEVAEEQVDRALAPVSRRGLRAELGGR